MVVLVGFFCVIGRFFDFILFCYVCVMCVGEWRLGVVETYDWGIWG